MKTLSYVCLLYTSSRPVPIMGTPVGYDTITFEDIRAIIKKYNIEDKLPKSVANYLMNSGPEEETPQKMTNDVDYYIVNTLPDSCKHAMDVAKEMGIDEMCIRDRNLPRLG